MKYLISVRTLAVVIFLLLGILVWYGFDNRGTSSSSHAQNAPKPIKNEDAMNINQLNALLESDGISFLDAALLPMNVEKSQTFLVRIKSESNSMSSGFSAQMTAKTDFSLLETKRNSGALARQRVMEFSPTQILIVAINDKNQVLWWSLQPDPRLFRAETSDDAGRLSGKTLYRNDAEMLVSLPTDETITEARFYHPAWNGKNAYNLEQIGSLTLKP